MYPFQDLVTSFDGNIHQETNANIHVAHTTEHLANEQSNTSNKYTKNVLNQSHGTDVVPKGDTSLPGTPNFQHGDTHSSNSQIKADKEDAELQFLQHHYSPSQDEDNIPKELLTKDKNMA